MVVLGKSIRMIPPERCATQEVLETIVSIHHLAGKVYTVLPLCAPTLGVTLPPLIVVARLLPTDVSTEITLTPRKTVLALSAF